MLIAESLLKEKSIIYEGHHIMLARNFFASDFLSCYNLFVAPLSYTTLLTFHPLFVIATRISPERADTTLPPSHETAHLSPSRDPTASTYGLLIWEDSYRSEQVVTRNKF